MPVNIPRLVYFEEFMSPAAVPILSGRDDLELVRLEYATPEADNQTEMRRAHGYQIQPRTELREPWFGDAALLARCPDILAISSTGAGYDMIDVDACNDAGVIVLNQCVSTIMNVSTSSPPILSAYRLSIASYMVVTSSPI